MEIWRKYSRFDLIKNNNNKKKCISEVTINFKRSLGNNSQCCYGEKGWDVEKHYKRKDSRQSTLCSMIFHDEKFHNFKISQWKVTSTLYVTQREVSCKRQQLTVLQYTSTITQHSALTWHTILSLHGAMNERTLYWNKFTEEQQKWHCDIRGHIAWDRKQCLKWIRNLKNIKNKLLT